MRRSLLFILLYSSLSMAVHAQSKRQPVKGEPDAAAVLPFRFYGNQIVIPAMVSGSSDTLHFIFDTGTEVTILHYGLAKKLNISAKQKAGVTATNNLMLKVNTATLNVLYLGKTKMPFLKVYLENIPEFRKGPLVIDGFIGIDLLKQYVVKIDYAQQQLVLYTPGTSMEFAGAQVLPFKLNFRTPVIPATIELDDGQTITGNYHVTTGGDYGLLFNWPYVQKNLLADRMTTLGSEQVQDLLKTYDYVNSIIPALSIGNKQLRKVPVSYCKDVNDDGQTMEIAGAIGYSVWKQFSAVIINYRQNELYLQP
ncbi:aspartyl protease family protein [Chitinophaga sp. GbtcB8]|uniref:aspartyl protease family protein n=1 Tax=Chitinophaga sp. GbtcB8 TaxID=2824753 RepID=UPI001C30065A|nr:aspartyl protease family protein [Chitinophaga sp. GbtcB8]